MAAKAKTDDGKNRAKARIEAALDTAAWDNLERLHPELASAVRDGITRGMYPEDMRALVLQHTGNVNWARFVESAARGAEEV